MATVLVYIESQGAEISSSSLELIVAAQEIARATGGSVEALIAAADPDTLAAKVRGADRVLTVTDSSLTPYVPESHGRVLTHVVKERLPDLVLVAYSSCGLDLGPTLAVRTDRPLIGYCTRLAVDGDRLVASSQTHGGKIVTETITPLPAIAAVTPGSYREEDLAEAACEFVALPKPPGLDAARTVFKASESPDPDAVDITQSAKLVCVGRGIGDADSIDLAREVADKLGAEIVGSRPVIDAGWLPKERQVGKSGHKVKPRLYVAVGVSGAPEHLEGMGSAEFILAVNSDPRAPIFDHAHLGTTVDLFDLLPALIEALDKAEG